MPNAVVASITTHSGKEPFVNTIVMLGALGGVGFLVYKYWYVPKRDEFVSIQSKTSMYQNTIPNFIDYVIPKALPPPPAKSKSGGIFGSILGGILGGAAGGVIGFFTGGPAGAVAGASVGSKGGVDLGKKVFK